MKFLKQLEDVEVGLADYMVPLFTPDFNKAWEAAGNQVTETYSLSAVGSIRAAVGSVVTLLGMEVVEGGAVGDGAATHTLALAGIFLTGEDKVKVWVRCRMAWDAAAGVTLEVGARGERRDVNERIANCIS